MKRKIMDWIVSHLVESQAILVICVFFVCLIAGINNNTTTMMIALLVFVGSEFMVLSVGYLERISNSINKLAEDSNQKSEIVVNTPLEWSDMAKTAEHDLLICTPTGGSLYSFRRVFAEIPSNVQICIIILNFNDNAALKAYYTVVKPKLTVSQLKEKNMSFKWLTNDLLPMPNVEIRVSKTPFNTVYVGRDIFGNTNNAKIKVQHLLQKYIKPGSTDNIDDKLIYSVYPDAPQYQVYYRQMKAIWDNGISYREER